MKPKINETLAEQTKPTIRTVNNEVKILVNDDNIANVITETINKLVAKCKQLGWAKELSYFQFANKKLLNPTRILNGLNKITIRDRQGVTIGIGYNKTCTLYKRNMATMTVYFYSLYLLHLRKKDMANV